MPCECHAKSVRHFEAGTGAAGTCKATVTVESECDQVELDEEYGDEAAGGRGCRVAYKVAVSAASNASAIQLTVDGEDFEFPAPIAPGKADFVYIVRPQPADCEKKKNGKVKLTCAGGKTAVIDKFEICVLS